MALFQENEEKKTVAKKATKKTAVKKEKKAAAPIKNASVAYKVLVEPWITEKSHTAMALNKYTFKVTRNANKKEVKKAVEGVYGVTVEKIAMVTVRPEKKAYGRYEGTQSGFKKATVTVKAGEKIEFFAA